LKAARLYAPAVVFYEDVDVLTAEADAERVQQLLEAFDGIRRKGEPVRVVLTSNYPERIHKGLIRPGRIDAAIKIDRPDAGAIRKLVAMNTPQLDNAISDEAWDGVTGRWRATFRPTWSRGASGLHGSADPSEAPRWRDAGG
jgi:SpoVK/Ycf46/Vps4 family AAA+-type ATPase